ncbi:MAG: SMC-Scp complex subunit ScpB [Thermomicrobiales bacterium]
MTDETPRQESLGSLTMDDSEARAALESLLFVASDPVEISALAAALDWSTEEVTTEIERLSEALRHERRGIIVQRHGEQVQLVSAPRFGPIIERFLAVERKVRLSEAALETLAILAFRQPATRAEVEAIRGVDCSGVLSTLVAREMIEVVGRRPTVGNPIEYGTTDAFLRQFGLTSIAELSTEGLDASGER